MFVDATVCSSDTDFTLLGNRFLTQVNAEVKFNPPLSTLAADELETVEVPLNFQGEHHLYEAVFMTSEVSQTDNDPERQARIAASISRSPLTARSMRYLPPGRRSPWDGTPMNRPPHRPFSSRVRPTRSSALMSGSFGRSLLSRPQRTRTQDSDKGDK